MADKDDGLTEELRRLKEFLSRPRPNMTAWREALAAETKRAEAEALAKVKTGDVMPDGSIYLGLYNDKDWFVAAEDVKDWDGGELVTDFNTAALHVKGLTLHGHNDWIIPPGTGDLHEPDILYKMFNSKNIGAFEDTYSQEPVLNSCWYWSSTAPTDYSDKNRLMQSFDLGIRVAGYMDFDTIGSVRCVRSVPRFKPSP